MLIVRGTKKLRDRVRLAPAGDDDESTTVLGDWFATAIFWRPQAALFVNGRTLLPVFVPLAPAATLLTRAPAAIVSTLRRHGVSEDVIATEFAAMRDVRMAPTNNRSVVGVMTEFTAFADRLHAGGTEDLEELSMRLAEFIVSPLSGRGTVPAGALAAVLGTAPVAKHSSNVIPFPGAYRPSAPAAPVAELRDAGSAYQLKITISDIRPPVWRRVLVDGSSTLSEVHEVIQAAFGWWNYHLHEFEIDGTRYGVPDPDDDWGPPTRDERSARLDSVATAGTKFDYMYDFGDGWAHKIVVEDVVPAAGVTVPSCVGGRRAGPPEDCGGPWGYQALLEILADPRHPEFRERAEWIGGPFDPEHFDPEDFEFNLAEVRAASFDR